MSKLNEGSFRAEDLVLCYAPANLYSVMPGNKVMLRSGGPKMTVVESWIDEKDHDNSKALCMWGNDEEYKETYKKTFWLVCLTCYGAE